MPATNGVMMQYFHWYCAQDGTLWNEVRSRARELAEAGITGIWLPPAYKGSGGPHDVGYGVYDMYDLGEFDQKGSVRTKYGTRDEYLAAIKGLQAAGLQVYADTVLNHRMGGDMTELVTATPFAETQREELGTSVPTPTSAFQAGRASTRPSNGRRGTSTPWTTTS
jgi:alpha-amylase